MLVTTKIADWLKGTSSRLTRRKGRAGYLPAEVLEERRVLSAQASMGTAALGTGHEWIVSNGGDDWGAGSVGDPFKTIRRALDAAAPGDTITLRNGVYEGGINIDVDNLTIRSAPGEWAVIESPLTQWNDGHSDSVLRYGFDVEGGRLENLEITGGYWYGVMFWDWWDSDFEAGSTHMGASNITIDGCKIHDTGVDAVKITPGANDISILNSEIYNTGRRSNTSSDGIDNNNGDRMIARGNYIHDIEGIGILTSGGTEDSLIEQNLVVDTRGAGIVNGFYTELEWIEPDANPGHFASIDTIVRNNIVVNAGQAGVGVYGALNAQVYNNTLVNAADDAQAPIQFGGYDMWVSNTAPSYEHIASVNPSVLNNIIVTNSDNITRMVDIREGSITGPLTLDYNLYHGSSVRGTLFIDRNLTGDGTHEQTFSEWQTNYGYDQHSMVGDPFLDASWHLTANSPAIGKAFSIAGLTHDFDGNVRAVTADPPSEADPPTESDPPSEADPPAESDPPTPDLGADEFNAGVKLATPPAAFGAPSIEIDSHGYHDYEAKTINVRVVRHGTATDTVTVQYATLEGTARAGQDFAAVAGTLTFAPGETEKIVPVTLLGDDVAEGDEHFLFTVSNAVTDGSYPVRLGHQSTASMTIDDEETPITLNYATKWVSNEGSDVTGDGSADKPWKSLQHAADQAGPGDYVIVKPGNYWGFQVSNDGKADARITFHAMPGVVIDAPNPENNLDGINLEGADYVTVEGFSVSDMPRAGLRSVLNTGAIIRDNVSDHNGYWGILTGWSYDLLVENNHVSRSQREHGIYISNSSDDAVIRNNVVWGNNDSGIQFNADRYLEGDGIHSRNVIEGNVLYGNGVGGGATINLDGFQDGIVRNNLLYDNHSTGIVLYVGYAADGSKNNVITNNTVVMAADARWALLMTEGSDGNVVTNNILLNKNPNRGSMTVEHNSLPARSDNNIVQNLFQMDGANGSFGAWQNFSGGQDTHSIVIDQSNVANAISSLFVNAAGGDFHLKANSAAIDVGDPTGAPATDIYGHARPTGAGVDIGAFEAGNFLPAVQFEWNNVIGYEFIGMAEVAVTRTGDTSGVLLVDWATGVGSATAGSDYEAASGQFMFQPGETRKTFRVFVNDDAAIESPETVPLSLSVTDITLGSPTAGTVVATDDATLHVISDDAWQTGKFQFDTRSVTFNETAGTATVTVHRVGGSSGAASINFATDAFTPPKQATWVKRHTDLLYPTDRDTPATAGQDYSAVQGTLNFADGETEKTITIPLLNDDWYEGGEAFTVKLSNAVVTGANGNTQTGNDLIGKNGSIKVHVDSEDVKLPGTFQFGAASYVVTEGTPSVNVTITRTNGGNVEASVRLYDTGAGNGSTTASAWAPSDYGSLPAIVTFAPGELSKTISIPILDDSSTEMDEAFSIQLYSPTNDAAVGAVAKTFVTIQDNESTFYFLGATPSAYSYEAVEGTGKMPITVVRQGALTTAASVTITTSDGSATGNVDYTPINMTLNFAPGEASKVIEIPVINETLMESKESFYVNMSNAVGAQQGSWSWSSYIIDDDASATPGKFELSSPTYSFSEAGGTLNVTVNRVGGSSGTVTVQYATSDGASGFSGVTAYAGADYTSKSGTLTFAPGETSKTISIPITNDTSVEANEVFTVSLKSPAGGATLGTVAKAVVTIVEDDSAIEFGTSNYTVNEDAGYVTITIVRKGSTVGAATVDLNISSGPAEAGKDFIKPGSSKVTFADGEATATVQIQIIDDLFKDPNEYFYLSLANAVGSKLGSSLYGNVKITDND